MNNLEIRNNFIIREYRNGDFDRIVSLWTKTDLNHPIRGDNENVVEESLRIGGSLLVMEEISSSVICGSSWMTYDGRRIHLHHFGILPEYQGKGLGKLLLDESLKFCRRKGCQIKLEVNRTNIKAINMYTKAGFVRLGDYDVYIIRDINKLPYSQ